MYKIMNSNNLILDQINNLKKNIIIINMIIIVQKIIIVQNIIIVKKIIIVKMIINIIIVN